MPGSLSSVPLLHSIPAKVLRAIDPDCQRRRFARGETVFSEGKPARFVWIIRAGWIYLTKRSGHGEPVTIFVMTPDEALCGVSAFDRGTYAASAVAATETDVIGVPADAFARLLDQYPDFARQVLAVCCHRIRQMAEMIGLAHAPVEQRLAHTLLRLHATFGRTIPVTHHELARMAGTRWETSIRVVAALRRRGWLATSRGKMALVDPESLRAMVTAALAQPLTCRCAPKRCVHSKPLNGHAHRASAASAEHGSDGSVWKNGLAGRDLMNGATD